MSRLDELTGQPHAPTRLVVRDLTVSLCGSKAPVVADLSLTLEAGRVLALVGESGSGKSTAGLAMLGWARSGLTITGGSVLVDGYDVLRLTGEGLRSARGRLISYVPQDPSSGLNPAIRVGTQMREALLNHPESFGQKSIDGRVAEMLEEVGLPPDRRIIESYPHQLSGGQQQRVVIAMAFACRPRVVVLDEPTTGLDVTTQRRVLETIRTLADRHGVSAVYVSHDLAVVANIADETAVMYAGRIVESGPTQSLFHAPRHRYTVGLLAAIPDVQQPRRLTGIDGRPPRPGTWPKGCSFADRCTAVTDECRAMLPAPLPVGDGHTARCIHPADGAARPTVDSSVHAGDLVARPLMRARRLQVSYGRKTVLHGIDVDVGSGKCTAIVGESGSGKTTLARCLVGLNPHWTGDVTFQDQRLAPAASSRSREERRRIQYIFQNPYSSMNPRMTIGENLGEPLRFFRESWKENERAAVIHEALEAVALSGSYFDRMPDQLSGGERQRAAIARALVVDPDLLVCDEVTSALDVSVQAQVVERLRHLQLDRGLSMLFITHNLAVVRSIAQYVVVVSKGHVVESGRTEDVLERPKHDYTKALMSDLPRLPLAS